ncbi:MAG: hypothetical protein DCC58_18420 [Chloroflexi bacterium]|nr:MAG: hypothetical protein DCC58_18420 [Chloroflexota bacterium]
MAGLLRRYRIGQLTGRRRRAVVPRITLFVRPECHLCHDAESMLLRSFRRREIEIVDVMSSLELENRYILRVPVIAVDGQELAEGQITMADMQSIRRALVQTRDGKLSL